MNTVRASTAIEDHCPSARAWSEYLRGAVDAAALDRMSHHLVQCTHCSVTVESVAKGETMANVLAASPFLNEENYARLVVWLKGITISSAAPTSVVTTDEGKRMPATIGRFLIRGVLGTGGFGKVYLADDPVLKRSVALKAPHRSRFGSDAHFANFLNEARHAAALDHPAIVPVYDVLAEEQGHTVIVMKHVNGRPLSAVQKGGSITLRQSILYMIQIAKAVHYAHEQGFVHRDLKPSNVMVGHDGSIQVLDFGLGFNCAESDSNVPHGGTLPYMSPEQVQNDIVSIDRRADIWSLGVMLAELVHGRRPFSQRDRQELRWAILSSEPLIESARETVALDIIIRRCLEKAPSKRYETAESLAYELIQWSKRHFPSGASKWKYGWRRNVALTVSCLILVVAAWALIRWGQYRELQTALALLQVAPANEVPRLIDRLTHYGNSTQTIRELEPTFAEPNLWKLDTLYLAMGDADSVSLNRLLNRVGQFTSDETKAVLVSLPRGKLPAALGTQLASAVASETLPDQVKLRFAALLADLSPDSPVWNALATDISMTLASLSVDDSRTWLPFFDNVGRHHLTRPLRELVNNVKSVAAVRAGATRALARFLSDDMPTLADTVVEASDENLAIFVKTLMADGDRASSALRLKFDTLYTEYKLYRSDFTRSTKLELVLAKIAVLLWNIGDDEPAIECLQDSPNPTLQYLVVYRLVAQQATAVSLVNGIERLLAKGNAHSRPAVFGLLLSLAQLPCELSRAAVSQAWLDSLINDQGDAGIRSVGKLIAARLDVPTEITIASKGNWAVYQIGNQFQDFAIIEPCVGMLGDVNSESSPPGTTSWRLHARSFDRRFAIALTEATTSQFRDLGFQELLKDYMFDNADPSAAMMLLNLDAAYEFCNRASLMAGLIPCYEFAQGGQYDGHLVPKEGYLQLSGYRLPTDGEWELACRAGSETHLYFGNIPDVIATHGWVSENKSLTLRGKRGELIPQKTAQHLPNRLGLFDVYGNAKEICDMSVSPEGPGVCLDRSNPLNPKMYLTPLLRGCALNNTGAVYAASQYRTYKFAASGDRTIGLRLARTINSL